MDNKKKIKFYKISKIESILIAIIAEGQQEVWESIEEINNPIERIGQRKLYFEALKKLEGGK